MFFSLLWKHVKNIHKNIKLHLKQWHVSNRYFFTLSIFTGRHLPQQYMQKIINSDK